MAVNAVSSTCIVGEVHAVIGTNGAGKSTLINMLSGEIAASEGRITLDGVDVTALAAVARARAGIGRSYQRTTIFPEFTRARELPARRAGRARRGPGRCGRRRAAARPATAAAREALDAAGLADDAPSASPAR